MKDSLKISSLLNRLILIIISVISISTLCLAKDSISSAINTTEPKSANNNNATSQAYSFTEQPFDAIQLNGAFEMTAQVTHQPHTANVIITTSDSLLPYIKVYVKNKTLYISKKDDREFHPFNKIKVTVSVENLKSIKTNGSSNSHINDIKADDFAAEINGSGNIVLQGNAEKLAAEIHGSGEIDAKNLMTKKTNASIYGSGYIIANATQKMDLKIYGSGKIEYYGHPQKIEQAIYGSGKTKDMGI
ncbi:MAG: hypothetical protein ACD_16C00209G0007 [uncultured bacterium]|nr:MAG: hypothetical protein ACD_16C00209G0007 [uncultured bacterium]HBG34354.1 hypothetical protein [Holosporales bacterium]HBW25085.1 hypothetical protein [Holosporales bacterium]HCC24879.1 hypothetical protein [Holosporales bacterium]HCE95265.1 hypothetical protein [Holosporales bacterium]